MSSSGNAKFGFRHGLAIAQLVCFSPAILYAWSFRSTGRIGSFCIGVFSILRVVGASTKLASLNSTSSSLRTTNFVCESLGIILLTFLYLEFPKRINQTVPLLSKWYFKAVSIFMLFDLGLSIGGYVTMAGRKDNVLIPTGWTIASSVVVAFVFCYTVALFIYFWLGRSRHLYGPEEHRLLLAPAICTLPLLVRHVEPLIFVGTADLFWNQVVGNGFVYLFMILIPEVIIIAVSIWCIRGVEPLPKERKNPGGEGHLELSSSASHGRPPSGQEPPQQERYQLRRRATP